MEVAEVAPGVMNGHTFARHDALLAVPRHACDRRGGSGFRVRWLWGRTRCQALVGDSPRTGAVHDFYACGGNNGGTAAVHRPYAGIRRPYKAVGTRAEHGRNNASTRFWNAGGTFRLLRAADAL